MYKADAAEARTGSGEVRGHVEGKNEKHIIVPLFALYAAVQRLTLFFMP